MRDEHTGAQAMKLLAFDTGTEAMSVAVCRSDAGALRLWQHQGARRWFCFLGVFTGVRC